MSEDRRMEYALANRRAQFRIAAKSLEKAAQVRAILSRCREGRVLVGAVFTILSAVQWPYELVPRNEPLTAAGAFTDKLRLCGAFGRHKAMAKAQSAAALAAVRDRYGASTVLTRRLAQALAAEGREQERAKAQAWLA